MGAASEPRPGEALAGSPLGRPRALRATVARGVLLGTVVTVAVCGFVYELVIIALGTYLLGDSVSQVSLVLATFVSAMGLGSLVAKPLQRQPAAAFVNAWRPPSRSWAGCQRWLGSRHCFFRGWGKFRPRSRPARSTPSQGWPFGG